MASVSAVRAVTFRTPAQVKYWFFLTFEADKVFILHGIELESRILRVCPGTAYGSRKGQVALW